MIIDTLVTVFEADTKPLLDGAKKADKAVSDVEKGIKEADKSSKELGTSFDGMVGKAVGLLGSLFAVGAIASKVFNVSQQALDLKMLSDSTQTSMETISAWGHAAVETGGSAKAFQDSLKNLTQGANELALTGNSSLAPAMRFLGLNFVDVGRKGKPAEEMLLSLSDKLSKFSKVRAENLGKSMGLDIGTIALLQKGRAAVQDLLAKKAELGSLDKKNAELALKFNVAMDETSARMNSLYMSIGSVLLPVLNALAKGIGKVFEEVEEHKPFFVTFAAVVVPMLAVAFKDVAIAAWEALVPMLIMAAPIIATIAVVTLLAAAVAFLVDDLMAWADGSDSITGRVLGSFTTFKTSFMAIIDEIKHIWQDMIDNMSAGFTAIGNGVEKVKSFFGGGSSQAQASGGAAGAGVSAGLGAAAVNGITAAGGTQINSQSSSSILGDNTNQKTYNIKATATVNTAATDATGVSKAVGDTIGDHIMSAMSQHDDGVRA